MAGFGLAIVFTIGSFAVNKAKCISKKLSEEDNVFVRKTVLIAFDAMKLFWAVFYSYMGALCHTSDENVHVWLTHKGISDFAITDNIWSFSGELTVK